MRLHHLFETIKKLPNGKYRLYSKKGGNLGTFDTRADAEKHEREVQFFKHTSEQVEEQGRDTLLTSPEHTVVINTPGDMDWYKIGHQFPTLAQQDPREFGQGDSDMVVTLSNAEEVAKLKAILSRAGVKYSEIGASATHPEIHAEGVAEAKKTLELPDIEVGDEVKVGKFKNRKAEVTGFDKDDHNQPVLKTTKGDQKLFKPRISKLDTKQVNEIEQLTGVESDHNFLTHERLWSPARRKGKPVGVKIAGWDLHVYKEGPDSVYFLKNDKDSIGAALFLGFEENIHAVSSKVFVDPEYRQQGIPLAMYKYAILKDNQNIASDTEQTKGSMKIWAALSKTPGINVYGWDTSKRGDDEFFIWNPDESPEDEMYSNLSDQLAQVDKLKAFKADIEQRYDDNKLNWDDYQASLEQIEDELEALKDQRRKNVGYKLRLVATRKKK